MKKRISQNLDQVSFVTSTYVITYLSLNCRFKDLAIFAGSITENEDPSLSLLGLHGNWIKCQTSTPPLHHCGYGGLSANHYILVNLSLGQVTVRHLITRSPSVLDPTIMWLLSVCTIAFICSFVSKLKPCVDCVELQRVELVRWTCS